MESRVIAACECPWEHRAGEGREVVIPSMVVFQSPKSIPPPLWAGGVAFSSSSDFPPMVLPARWRDDARADARCALCGLAVVIYTHTRSPPSQKDLMCLYPNPKLSPTGFDTLPLLPEESTEAVSALQKRGSWRGWTSKAPASPGKNRPWGRGTADA